jgi:hypothetical protein
MEKSELHTGLGHQKVDGVEQSQRDIEKCPILFFFTMDQSNVAIITQ